MRLTLRNAASQCLGLSDYGRDDRVRVLGDGAENFGRGGCHLLGCFLVYHQLLYVSLVSRELTVTVFDLVYFKVTVFVLVVVSVMVL